MAKPCLEGEGALASGSCSRSRTKAHLRSYLAEFDFRYNRRTALGWTDTERATDAMKGAEGKRLMYAQPR